MSGLNILVVDDEQDILDLVRFNLSKERFNVTCVNSGEAALAEAMEKKPDLVLLDLMLPGLDGLTVCRKLKSNSDTADIPVIMLTARGEEQDVITGLEFGADDYVTKPFSPRVLLARVRSVIRRRNKTSDINDNAVIKINELYIDPGKHKVLVSEKRLDLTFTEFRLLQFLAQRPGWVFSRYQIVDAIRGDDYPVTERSVDVQIVGLRKKLGKASRYIETVRNVGYRFKEI